jgi:enhancer of polycomb-like protein
MMEQQLYQKVTLENGQEVLLTPGGSLAHMGQNGDIWAQQQQLALAMQQQQQQASWVAAAQHMAQARVAQAQAAALQQQQQHEMPSAAVLRDWLESQAAGQQNANLALAQQLAAAQNGGGFTALLGQNVSGLNNASLGMAVPDEAGMQSNLNAALLSQIANANMSAVQQGGGNVGQQQQQHQGTSSTPPADALALLARLSGANNGDGRHQM